MNNISVEIYFGDRLHAKFYKGLLTLSSCGSDDRENTIKIDDATLSCFIEYLKALQPFRKQDASEPFGGEI